MANGLRIVLWLALVSMTAAVHRSRAAAQLDPQFTTVTTIAGVAGQPGFVDGPPGVNRFWNPVGIACDSDDRVYVAEYGGMLRVIAPDGTVRTLNGIEPRHGTVDGPIADAQFYLLADIGFGPDRTLYTVEFGAQRVRRVSPQSVVSTWAGTANTPGTNDGWLTAARFDHPSGVCVDRSNNVYVADFDSSLIRKITPEGFVSTLAGWPSHRAEIVDGLGSEARFNGPADVAVDAGNDAIRRVSPAGLVTTIAGRPMVWSYADGVGTQALFFGPTSIAVDRRATIYVSDMAGATIRRVTPGGVVSTVAGRGRQPGFADGTGANALLAWPTGLALGPSNTIYVCDEDNRVIRRISCRLNIRTRADFDGDGRSDFGVYRAESGQWQRMLSLRGRAFDRFGFPGTIPVTGDWDGDGFFDFGCYHPRSGTWFLSCSTAGFRQERFGFAGALPVVGDWDGDGREDIGCYDPATGTWYRMLSTEGFRQDRLGFDGPLPVTGDWDGDGRDDIGCYHPPTGDWFRMCSKEGFKTDRMGFTGTLPAVGDWDGDARDDFGCFDPATGTWYRMLSAQGFRTDRLDARAALPVVGDWDGDGRDDFGCYQPRTGEWTRRLSSAGLNRTRFGVGDAQPIP